MTPTWNQLQEWITPRRLERLWDNVEKMPSGCWLWRGAQTDSGHGQVYCCGGPVRVHRLTWLMEYRKDIPEFVWCHQELRFESLVIRHLWCTEPEPINRLCCNPAHCVGGCQHDNLRDIWNVSRPYKEACRAMPCKAFATLNPTPCNAFAMNLTPIVATCK